MSICQIVNVPATGTAGMRIPYRSSEHTFSVQAKHVLGITAFTGLTHLTRAKGGPFCHNLYPYVKLLLFLAHRQ